MIVLGYIGPSKGPKHMLASVAIGLAQRDYSEPWRRVTHVEHMLSGTHRSAEIASSSITDGGVRIKSGVNLSPDHWIVIYAPALDAEKSRTWFEENQGAPYDFFGAMGSVFWWLGDSRVKYFCNEACGTSAGQKDAHTMPPAGYCAWVLSQPGSRVITKQFFGAQ